MTITAAMLGVLPALAQIGSTMDGAGAVTKDPAPPYANSNDTTNASSPKEIDASVTNVPTTRANMPPATNNVPMLDTNGMNGTNVLITDTNLTTTNSIPKYHWYQWHYWFH